jgi:RNA polymerase sigma factor (sigma-70 family)
MTDRIPDGKLRTKKSEVILDCLMIHPAIEADHLRRLPEGKPKYPALVKRRAKSRNTIAALQERESKAQVSRGRSAYFWPEERDQLVDGYQDMIGRIVSMAFARGLPAYIERKDLALEQSLNVDLISILDSYKPRAGVPLDAYVWKILNLRLSDAIKEENDTDGITGKPRGTLCAFQLFEGNACDVQKNGRRGTVGNPDTDTIYGQTKIVRGGWGGYVGEYKIEVTFNAAGIPIGRSNLRASSAMISWGELARRELRRAMRLDVRSALDSLSRKERQVFELWIRDFGQEEIGVELHTSQSSVSRILKAAQVKLRGYLLAYAPIEYIAPAIALSVLCPRAPLFLVQSVAYLLVVNS